MRAFLLIMTLLVVLPGAGIAAPGGDLGDLLRRAPEAGGNPAPQGIVGQPDGPRVTSQQAASRVKRTYGDHKILSIRLIDAKGPPVYRVKTLSDAGVVKYVFVDGISGDVFE